MSDIRTHRRILETFTGPLERQVLIGMAARLPAWVTPDFLTGVGIVGGLVIFLGYWLSGLSPWFLWLASLGFVINWVGDSLDGTLARYRHIERPVYGFYIDHAVDAYVQLLIFFGLGFSPFVRFDLALVAMVGYMLLSILVYLRTAVKGEFAISYGRIGPTEARLIAISANTLVFIVGNLQISIWKISLSIYDWVAIGVAALLFGISITTTLAQARLLSDADLQAHPEARVRKPTIDRKNRVNPRRKRAPGGKTGSTGLTAGGKVPGQD